MQETIVYSIIAITAIIIIRNIVRTAKGKNNCGCGGCQGCGSQQGCCSGCDSTRTCSGCKEKCCSN